MRTRWAQWSPATRKAYLRRLEPDERARLLELIGPGPEQWATPGDLAVALDSSVVQTPALDLIDQAIMWAYTTPGARLAISIAPQEGKSERVTKTGSLWALMRNLALRIGIVSYSQVLAETFSRGIRNWITTFDGTDGELDLGLRIAPDYGSVRRWQLDGRRGGVICAGVGSGITGRPLDLLVIDDPFADREQAESEYYRERVWEWWRSSGSTRLAPGAPVIVIATRWHEDDLTGRLIAAEDGARWRVINIPALADHDPAKGQSDPVGRQPGEWLLSARGRTDEDWEQIKVQAGTRVFTALYQGRPSPDQGNVWLRQWWRYYAEPRWSQHPTHAGAWRVNGADEVVMSWDMAFKDTKSSDFVVGGVWGRWGADVYLLDLVHKRLSFTDTLVAFKAMVAKWPQATAKYVEDKANGTAVISTLKSKIPGIVPVNPTDSKYGRATAVAPFIEAGNVHLPAGPVALFDPSELVEEAASFPNAPHDDFVDMTSQALARLLLDGTGAAAWLAWAKRQAAKAARDRANAEDMLHECRGPDCQRLASLHEAYCCRSCGSARGHSHECDHRTAGRGTAEPAPARPPLLILPGGRADPVTARKRARDAALRVAGWPGTGAGAG